MYKNELYIRHIIEPHLGIPEQGRIRQYGVGNGRTLRYLHSQYGDRVEGFDLQAQPHTREFDLEQWRQLPQEPLAFVDIDVGEFATHWQLRLALLRHSAPDLVPGGIIMANSPLRADGVWQEQGHDWMIQQGFECYRFTRHRHEQWYQDQCALYQWNPASWCAYRRP